MSEFNYSSNENKVNIKILNNKGKLVKKLTYDLLGNNGDWMCFKGKNEYALITYYDDYDFSNRNTILIDKNGKEKRIDDLLYGPPSNINSGVNYYMLDGRPRPYMDHIYSIENNKMYVIGKTCYYENKDGKYYEIVSLCGEELFGNKLICKYQYTDYSDSHNNENKYALINIKTDKFISSMYDFMCTYDNGETYLVADFNDSKGHWGYLNAKGKKLAMFTDAAAFYGSGKYAPVIKGGNIYLIDKNMKQVSKTIKSDKDSVITTLGDELFKYTKGGKNYIMTNK